MSVTVMNYDGNVVRWDPDSRGKLQRAALELYGERGFERTTVAEIAERAGVTERTFFRHFADKREVLFAGGEAFAQTILDGVAAAPDSLSPLGLAAAGLDAAGALLQQRRPFALERQRIIAASAELRERELIKLDSLAGSLSRALRERGVPEHEANLAGEVGVAIFRTAFGEWIGDPRAGDLREVIARSFEGLLAVATSHPSGDKMARPAGKGD